MTPTKSRKFVIAAFAVTGYTLAAAMAVAVPGIAAAQTASAAEEASGQVTANVPVSDQIQVVQVRGEAAVTAELEARGYEIVDRTRTLLGRVRIQARTATHMREIVMHQSTGEILSDAIIEVYANDDANMPSGESEQGGGLSVDGGADVGGSLSVDTPDAGEEADADVGADVGGSVGLGD
ncbi:hypothetical protein [Nioella nitratireducens]|uniref:hypothetical protein n=1 Tax=Nioella nitratireducens TaxID=1287720 RepID=UPI0008FD588E|nr:hypothetical protein [Nioella nitratireducens]